ncbi:MAG: hybrid sensor histidine kinase/response regulator [Odoribacter sp.]|nr:hybrid sensor histidine kinase/response regulator [Odoribacter sp.]
MPINNRKYTLLLVHPSSTEATSLAETLRNATFQVVEATHYQEARQMAETTTPDLILVDAETYARHKNKIIQEAKKNRIPLRLPILLLANTPEDIRIPEHLNRDYIDFIMAPFHPRELVIRIRRQLQLLHSERVIRRQNAKLKQTLEARDKLYSIIAHDLRTPISTIKMINSSIESQFHKIKDPAVQKWFRMINETTEEAFNLLENLLRWTRNQNGKTKVYATSFHLNITIRQTVSLFQPIASGKNITIRNEATEPFEVYADKDMVQTVLRNLISNAIKFTYPGGQIEISAIHQQECILVSIKDNGRGISKENQKKLLKSNEYITTYGTKNEKGSGLGLPLSQDFIKLNKGKFWFSSQEGIGTTFFFTLPDASAKP